MPAKLDLRQFGVRLGLGPGCGLRRDQDRRRRPGLLEEPAAVFNTCFRSNNLARCPLIAETHKRLLDCHEVLPRIRIHVQFIARTGGASTVRIAGMKPFTPRVPKA
jgi:hypothetical protein